MVVKQIMLEGSEPPLSVMEARRCHLISYNQATNMATSRLDKFKPGRDETAAHHLLVMLQIIRLTLNHFIAANRNVNGWEQSIGIAGSSALYILEGILQKKSDGTLVGRWKENRSRWQPDDIDLFIGGDVASSNPRYSVFVQRFAYWLHHVTTRLDREITSRSTKYTPYVHPNEIVRIDDYQISGLDMKISLIQAPVSRNMADIVCGFDMKIVRVIYNPLTGLLHFPLDVMEAVREGKVDWEEPVYPHGTSEVFAEIRLQSSLNRVEKYKLRGYTFGPVRYGYHITGENGSDTTETSEEDES